MNIKVPLEECVPWARWALESRDGIEMYILYIMAFLTIAAAGLLDKFYDFHKHHNAQIFILSILSFFYYRHIGLNLPMSSPSMIDFNTLGLFVVVILFLFIVITMEKYSPHLLWFVALILLLPPCFVSIEPSSMEDMSFIFDPALKLLQGIAPSQIYFQYDLLLSIFAVFWIKLKINPYYFQILGQLSLYLLLISVFFFSRVFFHRKSLSIYLLVALVLFKIYTNMADPTTLFQVTPLRLDLWIIPLLLVCRQGPYHWSVALAVGSFIIFCRSFGFIYFLAYCELLAFLAAFDFYDEFKKWGAKAFSLTQCAEKQWRLNFKNFIILGGFFVSSHYLFKNHSQTGADIYLKLGLGFLPVKPASFYWYVPVVFSILYLFLLRQRESLKERYFRTAMFLLLLAIGQSIYFFGRSHENNLINISAILLLCLFTVIDLVDHSLRDYTKGRYGAVKLLPAVFSIFFILSTVYCYQQNIISRTKIQYQNLVKLKFIDSKYFYMPDMGLIKNVTHNSKHVYFMTYGDFLYYYQGGYALVGFYSPYHAGIFKKDVVKFLQDLLDKNYYLVAQLNDRAMPEMLETLRFENRQDTGNYTIVWNSAQNQ